MIKPVVLALLFIPPKIIYPDFIFSEDKIGCTLFQLRVPNYVDLDYGRYNRHDKSVLSNVKPYCFKLTVSILSVLINKTHRN